MQILQYSESIDRMFSLLTIGKDNKMVANTIDIEGTKRSVYLRESPKMMEEPRIEIVR